MRSKLILSFGLVVLVTIATVVLVARLGTTQAVRGFMYRGGMTGSEELVAALEEFYAANGSWQGVESLFGGSGMHGMGRGQGQAGMGMMNQRLRLADADGNLVYDSQANRPTGSLSPAELANAVTLQAGRKTVGYFLAEGGMSFTRQQEINLVNRLTRAALTAALIGGGLALILALFLAYRLLAPIQQLTQAAEKLSRGDLSQRVPVQGKDELARLGQTFNSMAEGLQRLGEARRAMTADIAHELRNPLAVQRANLEALQDGVYPLTPEQLQPILEQNLLLTRLVDDLRALAMAEAGQLTLERMPTDLSELAGRMVERFSAQAEAAGVRLSLEAAPNLPRADIDPGRVEQIITNLLSNALRYTPKAGKIDLQVSQQGNALQLRVHDSGPGIPAEALPHIFERFYRADRSRSRAEGGSGLGLAIARQFAEAHGGTLTAANHPQGGAVFTLSLPLKRHE